MDNLQAVDLKGRSVYSISTGQQHTCAIASDIVPTSSKRFIVCWGQGTGGVLGYGSENQVLAPGSSAVALPSSFVPIQVATYSSHTCALSDTGFVVCWGINRYGALGILSMGGSAQPCIGCKPKQIQQLKRIPFGCVDLSPNGACPALPASNPSCRLCYKGWSQSLCLTYVFACKWTSSLNQCGPRANFVYTG